MNICSTMFSIRLQLFYVCTYSIVFTNIFGIIGVASSLNTDANKLNEELACLRGYYTAPSSKVLYVGEAEVFVGLQGYENFYRCRLTLTCAATKRIRIRVLKFDTEKDRDKLKIFALFSNNKRELLDTWHGSYSRDKGKVVCSTRRCLLDFQSDKAVTKSGFILGAVAENLPNPLILHASRQVRIIRSTDYMRSSSSILVYDYLLLATRGRRLIVKLTEHSSGRQGDLLLYEGRTAVGEPHVLQPDSSSPDSLPVRSVYISSGTALLLRYTNVANRGRFVVTFHSIDSSAIAEGCSRRWVIPEGENLTVLSPNFPSSYPRQSKCEFYLQTQQSTHVLEATSFYFTTETCCDKVKIYDGEYYREDIDSNLLKEWSTSSVRRPVRSTCNSLVLVFQSDGSVERGGFIITVSSVNVGRSVPDCPNPQQYDDEGSGLGWLKTLAIVCGCFCAASVCCGIMYKRCRNKRRHEPPAEDAPSAPTDSVTFTAPSAAANPSLSPLLQPSAPPSVIVLNDSGAPPSYNDVMRNEQNFPKTDISDLPTYEEYRAMEPNH